MTKRLRIYFFTCLIIVASIDKIRAQTTVKDSIVQLYGVVMTADSLRAVPSASIIVEGKGRGTLTNGDGVFSIVVLKGEIL
ncbi:MAG: carboxypeptidase-like regulatory domain-containing protein [Chitinophagaceae bacterium]|nr:carboxypeptidase-like regulatory domain-containing protein [Chitinophagaceae bacterium]